VGFAMSTPEEHRAPVNPVELAVCSAVARTLEAAGVPDPHAQAPEVIRYLRRCGFAFAFRGTRWMPRRRSGTWRCRWT